MPMIATDRRGYDRGQIERAVADQCWDAYCYTVLMLVRAAAAGEFAESRCALAVQWLARVAMDYRCPELRP